MTGRGLAVGATILACLAVVLAGRWLALSSPGSWEVYAVRGLPGGYVAEIRVDPRAGWPAMMPGSSGDRPGAVTVRAPDGRSCGTMRVPMVNDVVVSVDGPVARVKLAARKWHLEACALR